MAISWFHARLSSSFSICNLPSALTIGDCWLLNRKSGERCAKFMTMPFLMNVFMLMQFQTTSLDSASAAERRKYFSLFYFFITFVWPKRASTSVDSTSAVDRGIGKRKINSQLICSLHYFHPSPRKRSRWEWWWKIPANTSAFESLRGFFRCDKTIKKHKILCYFCFRCSCFMLRGFFLSLFSFQFY